jgi:hypothetical protein
MSDRETLYKEVVVVMPSVRGEDEHELQFLTGLVEGRQSSLNLLCSR